jgi:hypothetical protein
MSAYLLNRIKRTDLQEVSEEWSEVKGAHVVPQSREPMSSVCLSPLDMFLRGKAGRRWWGLREGDIRERRGMDRIHFRGKLDSIRQQWASRLS